MKTKRLFLWIICVWLWTTPASAQSFKFEKWGTDFGIITVADTVSFPRQLQRAADSLARADGIILDLRFLPTDKVWSITIWKSLQTSFEKYTKPFVILLGTEVRKDQPLYHWMKERYWSRFEPSGHLSKAEVKIRTLAGRHMKEGRERMDWLMEQKGTK